MNSSKFLTLRFVYPSNRKIYFTFFLYFIFLFEVSSAPSKSILNEDLLNAVLSKDKIIVEKLLLSGADVNARAAGSGLTPLMVSAKNGDGDMLDFLLQKGASIQLVDTQFQSTAVHFAAEAGSIYCLKVLQKSGASFSVKNKNGNSPLHVAALNGKEDVFMFLLDSVPKKEVEEKDKRGVTALHLAAFSGSSTIIKTLVKSNLSINVQDTNGNTPLHFAVQKGNILATKTLLDLFADPNIQNSHKYTCLHYAIMDAHQDIARLLIERNANLNLQNSDGDTPLHFAANKEKDVLVKLLIYSGADTEIKNAKGQLPIDLSTAENRKYIQKLKPELFSCKNLFLDLILLDERSEAEVNDLSKGSIFQTIYANNKSIKPFESCLFMYLDKNKEKHYWTGTFLFDSNFTELREYSLAEKILKKAIELETEEAIDVSIHYTLGLLYWRQNKKETSRSFFESAYKLSEKYPDNIPALTLSERENIESFLKIRDDHHGILKD
jgi:ankyrin repeat protein